MKSKYLEYKDGEITVTLKDEKGIMYEYFIDSVSGILEWTYETLERLIDTFNMVDYGKFSDSLWDWNSKVEPPGIYLNANSTWDYDAMEKVLRENHDTEIIQSVLKCFDCIVAEIESSIEQ